MTKEGFTKILDFMNPEAGNSLLIYSWRYIRQTEYIVKMTKEASTKIINDPPGMGGGVNYV